jgi:hypothetical protein
VGDSQRVATGSSVGQKPSSEGPIMLSRKSKARRDVWRAAVRGVQQGKSCA